VLVQALGRALFVAAVGGGVLQPVSHKARSAQQRKPRVKILENGQWHESWVYGLQNNMCHSVTVQSGLEALN
jgi:hypothetical protein